MRCLYGVRVDLLLNLFSNCRLPKKLFGAKNTFSGGLHFLFFERPLTLFLIEMHHSTVRMASARVSVGTHIYVSARAPARIIREGGQWLLHLRA